MPESRTPTPDFQKLELRQLSLSLEGVNLSSFGPPAAGWKRCIRPTRITIMSSPAVCISVLLLPSGDKMPAHDHPASEVVCLKALSGSVVAKQWRLMDEVEKIEGSEIGFHDSSTGADCVCRGGMCPRREGCKFWVELMQERLQGRKWRAAAPMTDAMKLEVGQSALPMVSGRGTVCEYASVGPGVCALLEVAYGGGIGGEGTEETAGKVGANRRSEPKRNKSQTLDLDESNPHAMDH